MLHSKLKKRKINLRKAHIAATESPYFRERFQDAELIGDIHGWNLPMGSKRRTVHGDGFILLGDAAGLVDPFSGEGISNAMSSGNEARISAPPGCRPMPTACGLNWVRTSKPAIACNWSAAFSRF